MLKIIKDMNCTALLDIESAHKTALLQTAERCAMTSKILPSGVKYEMYPIHHLNLLVSKDKHAFYRRHAFEIYIPYDIMYASIKFLNDSKILKMSPNLKPCAFPRAYICRKITTETREQPLLNHGASAPTQNSQNQPGEFWRHRIIDDNIFVCVGSYSEFSTQVSIVDLCRSVDIRMGSCYDMYFRGL